MDRMRLIILLVWVTSLSPQIAMLSRILGVLDFLRLGYSAW
jgi:hypothetical protein